MSAGAIRRIAAASLVVALSQGTAVLSTARAGATEVSAVTYRALLDDAAAGDPAALAELRQVTAVDGQPVDLATALDTDDDATLAARLERLGAGSDAGAGTGTAVDAARARDRAKRILDDDAYTRTQLPRPLKRPVEWLRDQLAPITDAVSRALDHVVVQAFVVAGLLGGVALALLRLANRRLRPPVEVVRRHRPEDGDLLRYDPADLDRLAEAAGDAGDFAREIRLRFVAGLLRLERAGRIRAAAVSPSLTLRSEIGDPAFDWLAAQFDEVAYGDGVMVAADAAAARAGWLAVLGASAARRHGS
jgi:hypothetical protein